MALGAHRSNLLQIVIGQAFILVSVGLAIGLAGAFALTRVHVQSDLRDQRHGRLYVCDSVGAAWKHRFAGQFHSRSEGNKSRPDGCAEV